MDRSSCLLFILFLSVYACSKSPDPFEAYRQGDYKAAIKGFTVLSNQDNFDAMTHMGVIYHMGLGTDRDLKKAFIYYKQAADQNHAPAQYNLGLLYQAGLGIEQNYAIAYKYFSLAAKQNHHKAKLAAEILLIELRVR